MPAAKPPTDGLVGTNYTAAFAVKQVRFRHDFRPDAIEKEMAAAGKYFGIGALRGYLLSGNVGVRAHGVGAWFDNIVVVPADKVEKLIGDQAQQQQWQSFISQPR